MRGVKKKKKIREVFRGSDSGEFRKLVKSSLGCSNKERRVPPAESWPDYLEETKRQGHSGLDESVDLRSIVGLERQWSDRQIDILQKKVKSFLSL